MRNKIFQFLWFFIVKWLIPVSGMTIIDKQRKRMLGQYYLSLLFGGPKRVLIGDSNSAVMSNYRAMKRFKEITLSYGIGGTTPQDWIMFFNIFNGYKLYDIVKKCKTVIWNCAGNIVLQNRIETAEVTLQRLHFMFPNSWNITVPPIYLGLVSKILGMGEKTPEDFDKQFKKVNEFIYKFWSPKVLDFYKIFYDAEKDSPAWWALKDIVHYSKYAVDLIIEAEKHI